MARRLLLLLLLLAAVGLATRAWTPEELDRFLATYQPHTLPRPDSLIRGPRRFNYLERIRLTCEFLKLYQVSDTLSPHFGGIIEAEHMPTVIETDNTQEAIWVWARWFELTGRDDYSVQVRRAWNYLCRYPAYREHGGNPSQIWYAVWNCGLAFMAESRYRRAYNDTTYRAYADTCRRFFLDNPLGQGSTLDWFVTAQSAAMAYDYALETGDTILRDSALARGLRVRNWIEAAAAQRLAYQNWAMCGGTAFWGVARTFCRHDTIAGRAWLERYAESLPGFYPGANWNCSHNIWLANAYRSAAELTQEEPHWLMHHYLVDTLLMKDTDRDGGIPATWTDPSTQDQTWVSTYLNFMGTDLFVWPAREHDVAALEFVSPTDRQVYLAGDTIPVAVPIANCGLNSENQIRFSVRGIGYLESTRVNYLDFCAIETLTFRQFVATEPGVHTLDAVTAATPDMNPLNDTSRIRFKVYGRFRLTGTLLDSANSAPIHAWVKLRISGDPRTWDSCETDRSGRFSLSTIDTSMLLTAEPFAPYCRRHWLFAVRGDTDLTLRLLPAQVAVISTDPNRRYWNYYLSTLDTLGITHFEWQRSDSSLHWSTLDRLTLRTLIWFSGDATVNTIPAADCESLAAFALRSGNLFITGQNIAEELAGSPFLEQLLGCRFDSSGTSRYLVFGNRLDSLGALIPGTSTAGGNGAGNQNSRDAITALTARPFLLYDTIDPAVAGVCRELTSGGRVMLLGFGFEAVNRPSSRPTYLTRVQLMRLALSWLTGTTGIAEKPISRFRPAQFELRPTLCRRWAYLNSGLKGPLELTLRDESGRLVRRLTVPGAPARLDFARLPCGVYFLSLPPDPSPIRFVKVR